MTQLFCIIQFFSRSHIQGQLIKHMASHGNKFGVLIFVVVLLITASSSSAAAGLAANWGTQSTHPLPGDIVVKLLKENGFDKVKLFEADPAALKALGNSGIQVMVGIPNDLLEPLSSSVQAAIDWVQQNVSNYISKDGVNIRHVAVGNEPFLKTYKDRFVQTTFPALKNIQAALIKAGLGRQVKVTVPLNADVYQSDNGLPSGGNFRPDIYDLMISIIKFLNENNCPLTFNIYPFLSLYADPHFPKEYAYFDGKADPLVDGSISYTNVFDANFDTLVAALEKSGFPSMPVIVGEVGWPTDGDSNANVENAKRFNQGLIDRILQGRGTPRRSTPPDVYIFSLIDEDHKSIDPGNFERHWGVFNYDGTLKYQLNMGNRNGGKGLVPAKGVRYLKRQWCVLSPQANVADPATLASSINYACTYADCTSLGAGSSCGTLDASGNASYAFNMYYQTMNQRKGACNFSNGLSVVTTLDPTVVGKCRFEVMIDTGKHQLPRPTHSSSSKPGGNMEYVVSVVVGLMFIVYVTS
ncbi:Glucan endo-1,3-beta-glucosidase 6 [Linum grandiflorum]